MSLMLQSGFVLHQFLGASAYIALICACPIIRCDIFAKGFECNQIKISYTLQTEAVKALNFNSDVDKSMQKRWPNKV